MAAKHGIDCTLARNTGTWGSPTWTELTCVVEVDPPPGWDTTEIKTRASRVKFGAKTMFGLEFTFRVLCDDSDTGYTALMTAFQSLTADVDLLLIDGPVTTVGSFGFRGHFQIAEGGQPQPPDDVLYRTFKAVPYPQATEVPQYAEVTAGPAFTYTSI